MVKFHSKYLSTSAKLEFKRLTKYPRGRGASGADFESCGRRFWKSDLYESNKTHFYTCSSEPFIIISHCFYMTGRNTVEKDVKTLNHPYTTTYTVKQPRRFYGKISGNQLPVHFPLFLRASACGTFLEIEICNYRVMLTDSTRNTFVGFKGYMTKKQYMSFCYRTVPDS